MMKPGSHCFLAGQASMSPLERTLNTPLHKIVSPLDVVVAHPKFPHCNHLVLAHGYPQQTPTESKLAFERRCWRRNLDAHGRAQQKLKVAGVPTTFQLTWLDGKGAITTDAESVQIFNPAVFAAVAPRFTPYEEAQLASGLMHNPKERTSDLYVELHEGFGGSQQLQAFKARQEVVSSSLYNRALFSVFPELVPGHIAQARPEQRINAGSNQPQELGSSLAALVPESNQINSSRGARPVSSSSSSRHQESPLCASWTGQYQQPMETTGVQFRISATKEAKAAAKALKKDKKAKKAKDQTWQDKEVDRKRPRPDGEGDGNGGMC